MTPGVEKRHYSPAHMYNFTSAPHAHIGPMYACTFFWVHTTEITTSRALIGSYYIISDVMFDCK